MTYHFPQWICFSTARLLAIIKRLNVKVVSALLRFACAVISPLPPHGLLCFLTKISLAVSRKQAERTSNRDLRKAFLRRREEVLLLDPSSSSLRDGLFILPLGRARMRVRPNESTVKCRLIVVNKTHPLTHVDSLLDKLEYAKVFPTTFLTHPIMSNESSPSNR